MMDRWIMDRLMVDRWRVGRLDVDRWMPVVSVCSSLKLGIIHLTDNIRNCAAEPPSLAFGGQGQDGGPSGQYPQKMILICQLVNMQLLSLRTIKLL